MIRTTSGDAQCPRTHIFILKLWIEDLGEGRTEWRGQVKDVMSGEMRYFREWHLLLHYLKEMLQTKTDLDLQGEES